MDSDNDTLDLEHPQLDRAAAAGDLEQCQALVKQWEERLTPAGITARHLAPALAAAIGGKHPQVVSYLLKQGAVVSGNNMVLALGNTDDSILMFQTFLDNGWDINSKTNLGNVMLKHIICNEHLVRWFLAHGADPDPYGAEAGSTILDVAAANATPTIFDLLISHGARSADSDALHSAAGELEKRAGRVEMIRHLLDLGFDIDAMGRSDYPPSRRIGRGTPLHAAVRTQQTDRINVLVQRGANLEIRNTLGQTPLEYAVAKGFVTSETVLRNVEEAARRRAVASATDSAN